MWANSTVLKHASPYFAALLEGGFVEANNTAARESAATPHRQLNSIKLADGEEEVEEEYGDDSDVETDSIPLKGVAYRTSSSIPAGVKEVVIRDAAYTTYRAVLTWIHSGHINLAGLTVPTYSTEERRQVLADDAREMGAKGPPGEGLPFVSAAKSVYKLANVLEMPKLERLALDHYAAQLTPANVMHQLTTDIVAHEPVADLLIGFALDNWDAVRKTPAMRELDEMSVMDSFAHPLRTAVSIVALSGKSKISAA